MNKINLIFITTLSCATLLTSCHKPTENPAPITNIIDTSDNNPGILFDTIIIQDFDGNGLVAPKSNWWNYSNNSEMSTLEFSQGPIRSENDTAYHIIGNDINSNYWMGGVGHNPISSFGLPIDTNYVIFQVELYSTNATSNLEMYLKEDDGDIFKWQPSSGSIPEDTWTKYSVHLGNFILDENQSTGNGIIDNFSTLGQVQFTLLSGSGAGNTGDVYIDNIKFLVPKMAVE